MLLYKLLLIGGLCKDGFSSSSLVSLECVWPRAGLSSPHVVKVVCVIADSSDSLGLLDKFAISHKCSQRKCLHLQAEKKELKPAWPEDRCGVSTKLPSSVRQAFYLLWSNANSLYSRPSWWIYEVHVPVLQLWAYLGGKDACVLL